MRTYDNQSLEVKEGIQLRVGIADDGAIKIRIPSGYMLLSMYPGSNHPLGRTILTLVPREED